MSYTCAAFRRFYNQEESDGGLICNGTFYRNGFPSDVIDILETARLTETPLCIYWGNLETGEIRVWGKCLCWLRTRGHGGEGR